MLCFQGSFGKILATLLVLVGVEFFGCSKKAEEKVAPVPVVKPNLIRSDYKPNEIRKLCREAILKNKTSLDEIVDLDEDEQSTDSTLLAFETAMANLSDETGLLTFMFYVSPDENLRNEGEACERKVESYGVTVSSRSDLYQVLKNSKPRNKNEERLQSETLKDFVKNGAQLNDADRKTFTELNQTLASLKVDFEANIKNDHTTVLFTKIELAGLPEGFFKPLERKDGKYSVKPSAPNYVQIMENASLSETRKQMALAFRNKGQMKNIEILQQALGLRQKMAKLLGFKNWADYKINGRMAKDSENVLKFLNDLASRFSKKMEEEKKRLLLYKRSLMKDEGELQSYDLGYINYQIKKENFDLDDEVIREYFPTDVVLAGLFDIYSNLLGVRFSEVKEKTSWAPNVKLYEIKDAETRAVLAHFYLDFDPRDGKYSHFAAFPVVSGRVTPHGYQKPVSAIVGNFNPPEDPKPSLLSHEEVETLFHEFGHIMHQTLTKAPYASLSGSSVDRNFVEAPSQMLEEWVWSEQGLSKLSGHYLDHTKKLPTELLNKMIKARDFNYGTSYSTQIIYALYDMEIHSSDDVNIVESFNSIYKRVMGIPALPGNHFASSFGHLMGGYEAGYYGYLWSKVSALDLFSRFEKEGLLNPKTGQDYRKIILEQGGMVDPEDIIAQFLGRKQTSEAFYKSLGI